MEQENTLAAGLFIQAVTEWKNYLPHKELDGLSPFEYREKYPPGNYEMRFLAGLMEEYRARLQSLDKKSQEALNLQKDFASFQKQFLNRVPFEQPFSGPSEKLKTLRKIIIEERRLNRHPTDTIGKIGAILFADNIAERIGGKTAELDDTYRKAVIELDAMRQEPISRNRKRIRDIAAFFEKIEPYYRCGSEPYRFYLNYASVLFLIGNVARSLAILDKALPYKPDYKPAREMKARIKTWGKKTEE